MVEIISALSASFMRSVGTFLLNSFNYFPQENEGKSRKNCELITAKVHKSFTSQSKVSTPENDSETVEEKPSTVDDNIPLCVVINTSTFLLILSSSSGSKANQHIRFEC